MSDDIVTWRDAAHWLPADVRETIEATQPCPAGGPHDWDCRTFEAGTLDSLTVTIYRHWQCTRCGLGTSRDPARPN